MYNASYYSRNYFRVLWPRCKRMFIKIKTKSNPLTHSPFIPKNNFGS